MNKSMLARMFGVGEIFLYSALSKEMQNEASLIVKRISANTGNPRKDYVYGFNKKGSLSVISCHQYITKDFLLGGK